MGGKEKRCTKRKSKIMQYAVPRVQTGDRQQGATAIETIQQAAGLEEQMMAYLLKYRYGDDLVEKLAAAIDK